MKAIILAAGYGRRMRPLTDKTHKTLLKIGGKTLIERILESLAVNGIKDVVIVTGYRHKELEESLKGSTQSCRLQFVHNPRYKETNNIYSLSLAFQNMTIDDDIILIESDLVYEPSVIKRLLKARGENVALVDHFRSGMDGTVVSVEDGIISQIIPPHLQGPNFSFSDKYKSLNVYKFSKEFCNNTFRKILDYYSRVFDDNCYYEIILGILIYVQKEVIHAEILDKEKWAEIDDPNDLTLARYMFDPAHQLEALENHYGGYWNHEITDFCYIRNMYFPNSSILAEMKDNLHTILANYGTRQEILNQKLSYFLLYNQKHLNLLNGASQIYPLLALYFKGRNVLIPEPTFGEYKRIFSENHTYSDRVGINLSDVEKGAQNCDAVVFVNPNNPTGSVIETAYIYRFAESQSDKVVIVDESFIEFSAQSSIIPLLEEKPLSNIIVIKSFSKSLGIPGLRLGYTYCQDPEFNAFVREQLPIWNINSLGEYFLEIILKHRDSLQESFERTIKDREGFSAALKTLAFLDNVYPSEGNYILIRFQRDSSYAEEITKHLLAHYGIYVKNASAKFRDGRAYLRLAVRLPEENTRLVECLRETAEALKS